MDGLIKSDDVVMMLGSYGTMATLVTAMVGGLKMMFRKWIKGNESLAALILSYLLGVSAKIAGLYSGGEMKHWLAHLVCVFVLVVLPAAAIHNDVINQIFKKKTQQP